jgi:hypothetical protein
LVEARLVSSADHPDEAVAHIELWRYEPGLLATDGTVDRLSLFLSLASVAHERIRLAADSLLEKIAW